MNCLFEDGQSYSVTFATFVSSHRANIRAVTLDRKLMHSLQCESPGFLLNSFLSIVTRNFLASPLNLLISFRVSISFLKIVLNSCSAANPKSASFLKMIISISETTLQCLIAVCPCIFRSSRPEVFCEKGVLRNFAKFTGKHLCQSVFL